MIGQTISRYKIIEKLDEGGFFNYTYISTDPFLESIRASMEFQTILAAVRTRHLAFKQRFGEKFWSEK